jgi:hypothetical protein
MAGAPQVGVDAKAYYNSATHATPTWVLIDDIIDASPGFSASLVEIKSRASTWKGTLYGLLEAGVTFTLLHRKGTDTVRAAVLGIITGRAPKEFAFMDQAIATVGAIGFRSFLNIDSANRAEALEEGLSYDISAKGAYAIESSAKVDPDLYVVT